MYTTYSIVYIYVCHTTSKLRSITLNCTTRQKRLLTSLDGGRISTERSMGFDVKPTDIPVSNPPLIRHWLPIETEVETLSDGGNESEQWPVSEVRTDKV